MGQLHESLSPDLAEWIKLQKIFWVASAPLSGAGHVNLSPRAHECLTIVSPNSCYFIDMSGSGSETSAHMYERGNGRITVCFMAFEGAPRILRLYGKGKILERDTPEFEALCKPDDPRILPSTRAIVWIDFHRVGVSCGMSVPYFDYVREREQLQDWGRARESDDQEGKTKTGMKAYWAKKNFQSIDGLPSLKMAADYALQFPFITDKDRAPLRIQQLPLAKDSHASVFVGFLIGIVSTLVYLWIRNDLLASLPSLRA